VRRFLLMLLLSIGGLIGHASVGRADDRIALVIGNANYQNTQTLSNSGNDATDVAKALVDVGFKVSLNIDVNKRMLDQAIEQFSRDASKADSVLFYYSGHGMQYQGSNYIVPVDAQLLDEVSVEYELTPMENIKRALARSKGVRIMILDSCRDNPLANRLSRSLAGDSRSASRVQGFARPEQVRGMVIAYATQANEVAADGTGRNSPFSAAFLKELHEPGLEIGTMFRRISADVYASTNGRQSPELSISLLSEYYLNQAETDQGIWARIRGSADAATIREFIARYPNSFFASDASARLELIEGHDREKAATADLERAKQEADERARKIATDAKAHEQDLALKLAAAESARAQLERELGQREAAQLQADEQQRAEKNRSERDKLQRETVLPKQIVRMQANGETVTHEEGATNEIVASERDAAERARKLKEEADQQKIAEDDRINNLKAQMQHAQRQSSEAEAQVMAEGQNASEAQKASDVTSKKVAVAESSPTASATQASAAARPPYIASLTSQIRGELRRLGCFSGGDTEWGTAELRRGVAKYALYAKLGAPPDVPSAALLENMKSAPDHACPLDCLATQIVIGERCVAKTCARNEVRGRTGFCVPKPATHEIPSRRIASAPVTRNEATGKGHCLIFNGNQFCQ